MALLLGYDVGSSSLKATLMEAENGKMLLITIYPKKEQIAEKRRKRVDFWKAMKWTIPVFLAIFSSFYIYRLTIITGPLGEMKAEIKHLHKENEKLNTKIEGLQNKLSQVKDSAVKNELGIENLREGNTQLENLSEKEHRSNNKYLNFSFLPIKS